MSEAHLGKAIALVLSYISIEFKCFVLAAILELIDTDQVTILLLFFNMG